MAAITEHIPFDTDFNMHPDMSKVHCILILM
uniref:Uncharacterized protein n=1 Tax=Anguilla anguilla TaxID=7936 RepID=A0A0E9TNF4_ANGAN